MRQVGFVMIVLALTALACNMPGIASGPTLSPSLTTPENIPPQQPVQNPAAVPPTELSREKIELITKSAVQIVAAQEQGGTLEMLWSGSGTLISPTGEIVTNCHVACGAPILLVLMTTNPDLPPEPTFLAEITHYDEALDLAILQITADEDGNPVNPTDLPYLKIGNSDTLTLADPIRIFGYPGVGGKTITLTSGSVSGFESAQVGGYSQRVIIKTDASISSGNSGGTAVDLYGMLIGIPTSVNPDVREDVTIGSIGVLRPANLITVVQQGSPGSPPLAQGAELPPSQEPDPYEPNDDYSQATGPIVSGSSIQAYISWEKDIDAYFIQTETTQAITAKLTNIPPGTDYDLYLLDRTTTLAKSETQGSEELIEYSPPQAATYWIVVYSYRGASSTIPYTLTITYDGSGNTGSTTTASPISVTGQAVGANTGKPLAGGQIGVLASGVSCSQFFGGANLDMSLVISFTETDARGFFDLTGIPRGADYAVYFIYGTSYACDNDWLTVPENAITISDLGIIKMPF
ncbi:MAG: trypsin-like peptidase domain-containing protein [Anaerolineae bacterium]|nr:trypsin-like peptidase domain-containing protein [Anaerolineae bacterium]